MKLLHTMAAAALSIPQAHAPERLVYATDDPFGGLFDVCGYDIGARQSVATRFKPRAEHRLTSVRLWLWNNDPEGDPIPITVSLREGGEARDSVSLPGETALESWAFEIPFTGFAEPRLFEFESSDGTTLLAHADYWIVIESDAPPGAAWAVGQPGTGFGAVRLRGEENWRAFRGAVGAAEIWGTPAPLAGDPGALGAAEPQRASSPSAGGALPEPPPCGADFDQSGTIDAWDVSAFVRAWARRDAGADFDENGRVGTPDAVGFLNAWCRGC